MKVRAVIAVAGLVCIAPGLQSTAQAAPSTDLRGLTQNWDKALPSNDPGGPCPSVSSRFTCVFNNAAVRDNETGLVWGQPMAGRTFHEAKKTCANDTTGGRKGWRLPSVHELASLVDPSGNPSLALPPGNPFNYVSALYGYWTATTDGTFELNNVAYIVRFQPWVEPAGSVGDLSKDYPANVWCVRGGNLMGGVY